MTAYVDIREIRKAVSRYFEVSVTELLSPSRRRRLALPRQVGMYLCCRLTDWSTTDIGTFFARDHSTVTQAEQLIAKRLTTDTRLVGFVTELEMDLRALAERSGEPR